MNGQRHQMNGLSELIEQGINFAQHFVQGFNVNAPQETKEEKVEPKVEVKVEPKVEVKPPTIQQKMPKKPEEKKFEEVEAQKIEVPKREEPVKQEVIEDAKQKEEGARQKEEAAKKELIVIEGANYLSETINLSFTKAYNFASTYPIRCKE